MNHEVNSLLFNYTSHQLNASAIIYADCLDWLSQLPNDSIHSIVTDPPYGVKEYDIDELEKLSKGKGGVWRIPPAFDGHMRAPLPRFTALNGRERKRLVNFFSDWARLITRVLRPGGHVFIATNAFVASMLYEALNKGGLEFRGQIIRVVRTLRGGDRPKNAEDEFPNVSSLPRGCYEPWGLFRKPMLLGMKVSDCLREFQTGGLRRYANGKPFEDLVFSERTPRVERDIADHPSLKPQSFLRQIVYASLPLGEGIIADPFMGSGSTVSAALALQLKAIGIERHREYFKLASKVIPKLSAIPVPEIDDKVGIGQQRLFDEADPTESLFYQPMPSYAGML